VPYLNDWSFYVRGDVDTWGPHPGDWVRVDPDGDLTVGELVAAYGEGGESAETAGVGVLTVGEDGYALVNESGLMFRGQRPRIVGPVVEIIHTDRPRRVCVRGREDAA
jgi:SOS-response transcriptional repressor LexA